MDPLSRSDYIASDRMIVSMYVLPKRRYSSTRLHIVTTQNAIQERDLF
jgi:hypothetical protein